MSISTSQVEAQLESLASTSTQKDRGQPYLNLLFSLLSPPPSTPDALIAFGKHFIQSSTIPMAVGRRVLDSYVLALCAGSGFDIKSVAGCTPAEDAGNEQDISHWTSLGTSAFGTDRGEEVRKDVVEGVVDGGASAGWCDEQMTVLRHLSSHLLAKEEDWLGAARALMRIPMEGTSRVVPDEEKLKVYIQIVRLLLECQEWGQAQTYFSRASLLIHSTQDKETQLAYRLSQARLFDFSARFNEAAGKYHEVSFDPAIHEDDRLQMLKAAVTTSILAPAGPQRSRLLASLNRDERIHTSLPPFLSTMLRKMLLEYIVRPEEVKEFESALEDHQRAVVEGGGTVLERAVREHNVEACAKVYDNISFEALASILNLEPAAAELTARRMIEQGRLRAWIDQPLHLLYFESRSAHDTDADVQGTAGGLNVEKVDKPIEPISWTERWDDRIRETSARVESIAAAIQAKTAVSA
ncbi:hypothetical protein DB88DRAFT_390410 [Papiliotrema laurentii]|uniref:COP9 signalosome complex subunit 4 n=1 Tax=Papiliotrema laurentii TaxID=5418 RepID=A0AAD9CVL8_PAPLA|nr:hypothetical protein DB88DRAFT_390410 [Papiliotrema laurentii]